MSPLEIFISLTYMSVGLELILWSVPSVASSDQLIMADATSPMHDRIEKWPLIVKLLLVALPTMISIFTFICPILIIGIPRLKPYLIHFDASGTMITIGVLLIIVSRIASISSSIYIRKDNAQTGEDFKLKTGNLFRYLRNPIVASTHLTLIGLLLIYPSYIIFFGAIIYFLNAHFRIKVEEAFLKIKFGSQYQSYLRKVRRYGIF